MKRMVAVAALLLGLTACSFDPVREAVNFQLDGIVIGEAMLNYKAMGKIKVNHQEEKGTISVVGTIDNESYTAEFPTSQISQMLVTPTNKMQVVFYLNKYVTDQNQEALRLDHCAIILDENGQETRTSKYDTPGDMQCTKLLKEINDNLSLI